MKSYLLVLILFLSTQISLNAQWEPCNNGLDCHQIFSLISNENIIYAGTDGCGMAVSTDNGDNWIEKNNGLKVRHFLDIWTLAISGNSIFAGTVSDGIFRTSDKGNNWERKSTGLKCSTSGLDTVFSYSVYTIIINDNNVFAGTDYGVYLSTNSGINWISKNNGLPSSDSFFNPIRIIGICGNNVFAECDGVFRTSDNGDNWYPINNGLNGMSVISLSARGKNIYAASRHGILLSTDSCENWQNIAFKDTTIDPLIFKDDIIFAGSGFGLFVSTNKGNSWTLYNSGLPSPYVGAITINDDYIFVATSYYGIYRAKLSDLGITDVKEKNQNIELIISPNPAIDFLELIIDPELTHSKIEVFSIEGIKMFETEAMKKIDVSRLVPGMYFVKVGSRVEKFVKI